MTRVSEAIDRMAKTRISGANTGEGTIRWQYFPRSDAAPHHLVEVVRVFQDCVSQLASASHDLPSNDVLAIVRPGLSALGFRVEEGKRADQGIRVPVLFGLNGRVAQSFKADAHNDQTRTVLEVEAGRGVTNYQFLKDLFEACAMHGVEYLVVAVRNLYKRNRDFDKVTDFFETLYASRRITLPLHGILVIGY